MRLTTARIGYGRIGGMVIGKDIRPRLVKAPPETTRLITGGTRPSGISNEYRR